MNVKSLYIEITNQCNLNCTTCYNRSGLNKERTELSAAQLEQIIQNFLPYGLERILLSGGEPTLHTELEQILDLIDRYPKLSFGISTNGTIHHRKLMEYLRSRDNFTLQLSLDGSCEETNASTRGCGHFKKALTFAGNMHTEHLHSGHVHTLSAKEPSVSTKHTTAPRHTLKMVISQQNLSDVEAFCQLAFSLGFLPELAFLLKAGNGSEDWDNRQLTPQQKLQILKLADSIATKQHAQVILPLCTTGCPYAKNLQDLSLCIQTDGAIFPCQLMRDARYVLGNALYFDHEHFLERLHHIAALARQRLHQDYGCEKCLLHSHCGKGCMAEAWNQHQDPLACDENCAYRKLQFLYHQMPQCHLADQ
ncbi:MAG: radical SAM protein [Lachnospiraceae bacterium]|nr:radical SAM protein [Lachnospiraceae bacterium]